jgi:tRNA pseudouridine55 synthase
VSSKREKRAGTVHGVLVVDKPRGPTSHDVVAAARRHFGTRRVGHAGTLDPMATGVLVLLFGEATKLSAHLTRDVKRYVAKVAFGASTDTLDAEGTINRKKELAPGWLRREALEDALHAELDRELQVPPTVSAIKIAGKSAHERARRGEVLDLAPRDVRLHEATVHSFDDAGLEIELLVSKGYYVRSFARDLGSSLGVPAHLAALRRTASGAFSLDDAAPWPLAQDLKPWPLLDVVRRALPIRTLTDEGLSRARDGKPLRPEDFEGGAVAAPPVDVAKAGEPSAPVTPPPEESAQPDENDDEAGDAPVEGLVACVHAGKVVALAAPVAGEILRVVRGIHDPGAPGPEPG